MSAQDIHILIADERHYNYAETICTEMAQAAAHRGTGIAKRTEEYIQKKMEEGKAVIAITNEGVWVGFCYIETWQSGEYVANSGLIISEKFRNMGMAKLIKERIFELSRTTYPDAKIFGLTTGHAVMKINSALHYDPVPYSELTTDEQFWNGCKSCVNYNILTSKDFKNCMCTAMLYDSKQPENAERERLKAKNAKRAKLPFILKQIPKLALAKIIKNKSTDVKK